jgi:hypothetical protein
MDERFAESSEDLALKGVRYTKEQFEEILGQTENYIRENPTQSLFYAFLAGYILNRLPVGRIVGGVFRLATFAIKPAMLIYGASKLYQAIEEE